MRLAVLNPDLVRIPDEWDDARRNRALWSVVAAALQDPEFLEAAHELRRIAEADAARRGIPYELAAAEAVLTTVQAVPFRLDPDGDWFSRSVKSTWRTSGDCEDLVALGAALAIAIGLDASMTRLPQPNEPADHYTLELSLDGGRTYRWAEPSIQRAQLGEHPFLAARRLRVPVPGGRSTSGLIVPFTPNPTTNAVLTAFVAGLAIGFVQRAIG